MDDTAFRQFLRRAGKQPHVIDELVGQVRTFDAYLSSEHGVGLDAAAAQDIHEYLNTLGEREARMRLRGVALHFRSVSNQPLARLASDLREQSIAETRQALRLREFRGVSADDVARLKAAGIVTVEHMLAAGTTPQSRQELAARTGVSPAVTVSVAVNGRNVRSHN